MNVIEVKDLSRHFKVAQRSGSFLAHLFNRKYRMIHAVEGINFSVAKGELVGFIGPNGAGKSTTIKMMTGILVPSSGEIRVLGNVPYQKRKVNASKIGVVFGQRSQLWWDLPVYDTFLLLKKIYKIPNETFEHNMEVFKERLGLESFYKQPVRQLSLGQRMRADIAASLLHNPDIIFLDEPTIGLDVVVKKQIREFIKEINRQRKVTVILTTHDMRDIEEICDRIVMIDKGKVVMDMPVGDVRGKLGGTSSLIVDFERSPETFDIPNVLVTDRQDLRWTFTFSSRDLTAGQVISKIASQHNVLDITIKEPEIEDIIREIYLGEAAVTSQ